MSRFKKLKSDGLLRTCVYCGHKFDSGWERDFDTGSVTICDTCRGKFLKEVKKFKPKWLCKLENIWLWFVAIVFLCLGVCALFIWIGLIVLFLTGNLK